MNPVGGNSLDKSCPDVISSNCVTYNGPDIPCLGLCKGGSITPVMYDTAIKLCGLISQLDLFQSQLTTPPILDFSKLNFGCLWTPTITTWSCPAIGQTFLPDASAFAINGTPGFCQLCPTPTTCVLTTVVPTPTTIANPTPAPVTLFDTLQLIINLVQPLCTCNPCAGPNKTTP